MKKNVIPVGYGQRYPSLKKLLCTVPLMAGACVDKHICCPGS